MLNLSDIYFLLVYPLLIYRLLSLHYEYIGSVQNVQGYYIPKTGISLSEVYAFGYIALLAPVSDDLFFWVT